MNLRIERIQRYSKSIGGKLYVDGKFVSHTLELPWRWNLKNISCIPPGKYVCFWRHDRGRIQLQDIPCPGGYRTSIQIHIGNRPIPKDTKGCILVGKQIAPNCLVDSQAAMEKLKLALLPSDETLPQVKLTAVIEKGSWTIRKEYDEQPLPHLVTSGGKDRLTMEMGSSLRLTLAQN
ncbi:MAG: hypothetical protein JRE64_17390 [Deltaproteobacteria bacterium]|nr:hypothetical protein [Deltaproteobacteria bacterium]